MQHNSHAALRDSAVALGDEAGIDGGINVPTHHEVTDTGTVGLGMTVSIVVASCCCKLWCGCGGSLLLLFGSLAENVVNTVV